MSFILDALRKSEHDRQRQTGPGLAEVAISSARPKTNRWAGIAVALLVINLVAVAVLMLWRSRDAAVPAAANAAATPVASVDASRPPPSNTSPAPTASVTATVPATDAGAMPEATRRSSVPAMLQPAGPPPPAGARNPLELEVGDSGAVADPVLAERAASVPAGPPAVVPSGRHGTVVYEAQPEVGAPPDNVPVMPTIDDMAMQSGMPDLHVDLHVYSARAEERFVFINKHKYREGDTLAEGPVVEQITRDGVVLSQHGNRFLLPRQ